MGLRQLLKQNNKLISTTNEGAISLSEGSNSTQPLINFNQTGNADSAKMAGTPAQKLSSLQASFQKLSTPSVERQEQVSKPKATANADKAFEAKILESLPTTNDRLLKKVQEELNKQTTPLAKLKPNDTAINTAVGDPAKVPEVKGLIEKLMTGTDIVNTMTALNLAMGRTQANPLTAAEIAKLISTPGNEEIAANFAKQISDIDSLPVSSVLDVDNNPEDRALVDYMYRQGYTDLSKMNYKQFRDAAATLGARFNSTAEITRIINDPMTGAAQKMDAQKQLRELGAVGVRNQEAKVNDLVAQVEDSDSIEIDGKLVRIESILNDDELSDLIVSALEQGDEGIEILAEINPNLSEWIDDNKDALTKLTDQIEGERVNIKDAVFKQADEVGYAFKDIPTLSNLSPETKTAITKASTVNSKITPWITEAAKGPQAANLPAMLAFLDTYDNAVEGSYGSNLWTDVVINPDKYAGVNFTGLGENITEYNTVNSPDLTLDDKLGLGDGAAAEMLAKLSLVPQKEIDAIIDTLVKQQPELTKILKSMITKDATESSITAGLKSILSKQLSILDTLQTTMGFVAEGVKAYVPTPKDLVDPTLSTYKPQTPAAQTTPTPPPPPATPKTPTAAIAHIDDIIKQTTDTSKDTTPKFTPPIVKPAPSPANTGIITEGPDAQNDARLQVMMNNPGVSVEWLKKALTSTNPTEVKEAQRIAEQFTAKYGTYLTPLARASSRFDYEGLANASDNTVREALGTGIREDATKTVQDVEAGFNKAKELVLQARQTGSPQDVRRYEAALQQADRLRKLATGLIGAEAYDRGANPRIQASDQFDYEKLATLPDVAITGALGARQAINAKLTVRQLKDGVAKAAALNSQAQLTGTPYMKEWYKKQLDQALRLENLMRQRIGATVYDQSV